MRNLKLLKLNNWSFRNISTDNPGTETDNLRSLGKKTDWDRLKAEIFVMHRKITILGCDPNSRWYGLSSSTDAELYIFRDLSIFAYGAVAYFRYNEGNNIKCSFIMGKPHKAHIEKKNTCST